MNEQIINCALEFAARWGFLTQDLFADFMCQMSTTQNYRYWCHLTESGLFVKSKSSDRVLLLSHKARKNIYGQSARPSRLPAYIDHDTVVARFLLTLQKSGMVGSYWLESDLISDPMTAYVVLGASRVLRIPDLVFNLKTTAGEFRCAYEVEKTTKTQSRYCRIGLAYLDYSKMDLIFFGCGGLATAEGVRRGFQGKAFTNMKQILGIFQYRDFTHLGLDTDILIGARKTTIQNLFEAMSFADSKRNLNEKPISFRNSSENEAV